jgi:fumarylacetoacetase
MTALNETHAPGLRSWVPAANLPGSDFPIQNLPFGIFQTADGQPPRGGVAIGDQIFDLGHGASSGLFDAAAQQAALAACADSLNPLMALGQRAQSALRLALSRLLQEGSAQEAAARGCLVPMRAATLHMPVRISNYTDFFTSIYHATNSGRQARPDNPLFSNFKSIPTAYHGRASSIRLSGTPCVRPKGQTLPKGAKDPVFGASRKLDFEFEIGAYIGVGNALGDAIPLANADEHLFGLCLFNDWSARDIQSWETQPLGPFQGKNFLSSVSPWVVTLEALAPFRAPAPDRGADAPPLLPHLHTEADRAQGALDLRMDVLIQTEAMRRDGLAPHVITSPRFADQYWTTFQAIAHHTVNGCNLETGDLLGSGTVSGPRESELGCLKELTVDGTQPVRLPNGEQRAYLEDGDDVIFRARCEREGFATIGFGECTGRVVPAKN